MREGGRKRVRTKEREREREYRRYTTFSYNSKSLHAHLSRNAVARCGVDKRLVQCRYAGRPPRAPRARHASVGPLCPVLYRVLEDLGHGTLSVTEETLDGSSGVVGGDALQQLWVVECR